MDKFGRSLPEGDALAGGCCGVKGDRTRSDGRQAIVFVSNSSTKSSGEPIDPEDKGRGYEVEKGVYLQVEDEEIDAVAIESSHTIDIDYFVPKSEIDERYVDSPYYLIPENKVALEAFAVIRDAMRDKGMVALGRVVLAKRERVVMLQPWGKGLLGTTLRYPYEVRDEKAYFEDIAEIRDSQGHARSR